MYVSKLKIGHSTDLKKATGLTVFLFEQRASCGWWLCGSAPATREVSLLDASMRVDHIDALLFSGGSAFGLGAANGVMQFLAENHRGFPTKYSVVPIVPTACIYDFSIGEVTHPTAEDAYQACVNARNNQIEQGRVGAGTGATIGKLLATAQPMFGGFAYAEMQLNNGLQVGVAVVLNSMGEILDKQGNIVGGAKNKDGSMANITQTLLTGTRGEVVLEQQDQQNTTLCAVFTNAKLDRAQLTRIAKMTTAGLGRAISPMFTAFDGDVVFAVALDEVDADEVIVGTMAAELAHEAVLKAVKESNF